MAMQPHQQRVVDERDDLVEKLGKLGDFVASNPIFKKLPSDEQERLLAQHGFMSEYARVLSERIAAFPS